MSQYLSVFTEAAHAASLIPLPSEATIYAMQLWGGHHMPLAVGLAIGGGALGHCFNWGIGKMLMRLPSSPSHHPTYLKLQSVFNQYLFWLLALCFLPLMNLVVLISGMMGTPLRKVLPLVLLGLCYHYGQILFSV